MKNTYRTADTFEPVTDPDLLELGVPMGFLLPSLRRRRTRREHDADGHFGPKSMLDPLFEDLALFSAPHLACA